MLTHLAEAKQIKTIRKTHGVMKTLTTKQQERSEKKKKKLAALANLVKLNDKDRQEEIMAERRAESAQDNAKPNNDNKDDDGFIKVSHKKKQGKKNSFPSNSEEPLNKKPKIMNEDQPTESDVTSGPEEEELKNLNLSEDQYKQLKKELRERKRQLENIPSLRLREFGQRALLSVKDDDRTPIFLTDVQHLVMSALLGKKSPCAPDRWCFFDKPQQLSHTVVVCLEGLSLYHYLSNESKFEKINKIFDTRLEVVMPSSKKDGKSMAMLEELTQVPLTNAQAHELIEKHGSLEAAVELNKDPTLLINGIFPVEDTTVDPANNDLHPNDKFPRTKLLLSALQMVDEGYPMPLRGELNRQFSTYVMTKEKYAPVTNRSPMFGVDCEMCRTIKGVNELTRISIVNENCETVYETLVRPTNKIVDYLTQYSGITEEIMMKVTKELSDVHKEVRALLPPDAILVGQSLNCDLNAMRMMHPYVIDTSVCFNMSGIRKRKSKLQKLAMAFLKETIQGHEGGHDSVEDSVSSLKLVKLKLANSMEFGDEILTQKKRLHDIIRAASGDTIKNNLFAHASQRDKRTAIITANPLSSTVQELLKKAEQASLDNSQKCFLLHELSSNKEAVRKCKEILLENALTLCNLHITSDELRASSFDNTIESVNKWISKIWKNMAHNGLLLVLMGGASECSSGVAKIAIKSNVADVAAEVPLTV
ncbi:putative RNA exonuclease NEF-sp [Lucilia cuprina]|nr:putative RNA exonuclease NEF-sp [Lucilia cuprina]